MGRVRFYSFFPGKHKRLSMINAIWSLKRYFKMYGLFGPPTVSDQPICKTPKLLRLLRPKIKYVKQV